MKLRISVFLLLGGALGLFATACGGEVVQPSAPVVSSTILTISGSGSITPVLDVIAPAFEKDTPGYKLEILSGSGTGGGVQGVLDGVLDLAAMARPPKETESIEYVEFGFASQAIIVHGDLDIPNLTSTQIFDIFTGELTQWSDLGGPDLPIILYVRDEADSSTTALRSFILGETPFAASAAGVLTSQGDMLAAVEGTPGGIGIATWPTTIASGEDVGAVMVDNIHPRDRSYPMNNSWGIGFIASRQTELQPLIDWLLSDEGQMAMSEYDVSFNQ